MKIVFVMAVASALCLALAGCGSDGPPAKEYDKKAFEKTAPPAEFIKSAPKAPSGPPPSPTTK